MRQNDKNGAGKTTQRRSPWIQHGDGISLAWCGCQPLDECQASEAGRAQQQPKSKHFFMTSLQKTAARISGTSPCRELVMFLQCCDDMSGNILNILAHTLWPEPTHSIERKYSEFDTRHFHIHNLFIQDCAFSAHILHESSCIRSYQLLS